MWNILSQRPSEGSHATFNDNEPWRANLRRDPEEREQLPCVYLCLVIYFIQKRYFLLLSRETPHELVTHLVKTEGEMTKTDVICKFWWWFKVLNLFSIEKAWIVIKKKSIKSPGLLNSNNGQAFSSTYRSVYSSFIYRGHFLLLCSF